MEALQPIDAPELHQSETNEDTALITKGNERRLSRARICYKYRGYFCIRSRAAILILVWNMCVSILQGIIDPSVYFGNSFPQLNFSIVDLGGLLYGCLALMFIVFPFAGFLADVCCGRYKTVICSLWGLLIVLSSLVVVTILSVSLINQVDLVFLICIAINFPLAFVGYVAYFANIIQFGFDQLQDSPAEDSTLYIHWYVWTYYFWTMMCKVMESIVMCYKHTIPLVLTLIPWPVLCFFTLLITLSLTCCKYPRQWFIVDPASQNPYRLVYKVLKFAFKHRYPIRRSAFTYCEDELPSRLDLGKNKYGGPFTTEEVEDVKAFVGILCVLITLGPFFMVDLAAICSLPLFSLHLYGDSCHNNLGVFIILQQQTLTPILIVVLIPLHIFILRPFIKYYIPGMLKRMGLAMTLVLFSLLSSFATDTVAHVRYPNATCMFEIKDNNISDNQTFSPLLTNTHSMALLPQNIFNALGYMFFYIAAYEFLCAQTPHSMKGLIIGVFFAIKGISQLIGFASIFIPFTQWGLLSHFPSCGFVYYLINIVIATVGILAYTLAARRYQYRQRDEPSNIRRYVEDYYEKLQHYDDDDDDDYSKVE